jgi:hypothetical protein
LKGITLICKKNKIMVKRKSVSLLFWHTTYAIRHNCLSTNTWYPGVSMYRVNNYNKFKYINLSQYSDSLQVGQSRDRIPVEARFSTTVHTGPGAHPASYTMGTRYLPRVKWPGRGADHPPPSSAEFKERVELYLYSPPGRSWPVLG